MSVDPKTNLSELQLARYRVMSLLMQSEDLLYLERLEQQLKQVLDPAWLALEKEAEVSSAPSLVLTKAFGNLSGEELNSYIDLQRMYRKPPTKEAYQAFLELYDEPSEDGVEELVNTD